MRLHSLRAILAGALAVFTGAAEAQTLAPMPAPILAAQDVAYPGTIQLNVDVSDTARGIFRVHETIPVSAAGPLTLLFPMWMPGDHTHSGQIEKLAGLTITANGAPVAWRRDVIDPAAFHVVAPEGAAALEVSFQFLSATDGAQGPIMISPEMLNLEWNSVVLYPAGYYATRIQVAPSLTMPEGWTYATALGHGTASAAAIAFAPVDLSTLVDSPVFAGRYGRRIDLDPGGRSGVFLNIFGDRADQIVTTDAQIAAHRRLIRQADRLFGARHFDHYDFLLSMSDQLDGTGLEHHRSSQNIVGTGYFTDWDDTFDDRDLLAHEMTHSWNGKYRRPADLWVPNFNTPMRDSLLWVYEGQTQYWGYVLSTRAGILSRQNTLDALATIYANLDGRPGRHWRPLEDTTNDPVIADRPAQGWRSWQRSEDYYDEGALIWLEADTLIRERTHGGRSLDDFARAFFGGHDGQWAPVTYTFDDVVAALNRVAPYDWASFLHARLDDVREHAPLEGLARAGYRLSFVEERSPYIKALESSLKRAGFMYSLGFTVGDGDTISEVMWDSPAFNQGLTRGSKIVAVNGVAYDADGLRRAVTAAKTDTHPIELLIENGDHYRTISIDYHDGLRYPKLERIAGAPDRLASILSPR